MCYHVVMKIAVFPGTFDPPTLGHLNIIERASRLFDQLHVVVAQNESKKTTFSAQERQRLLEDLTASYGNVTVHVWDSLIVDYCAQAGASILVRGIRNSNDFSYEFDLSLMNRSLDENIETLFMPTDQQYLLVRSSSIKELAKFGGNISRMVPPLVEKMLKEKLGKN